MKYKGYSDFSDFQLSKMGVYHFFTDFTSLLSKGMSADQQERIEAIFGT